MNKPNYLNFIFYVILDLNVLRLASRSLIRSMHRNLVLISFIKHFIFILKHINVHTLISTIETEIIFQLSVLQLFYVNNLP